MEYIKLYEAALSQREELLGKLLHLYGSIPVSKQKSNVVIKKILYRNTTHADEPFFKLGEDINMISDAPQDKVRFVDYFDSLINSKETRGHNFEGTIAGLYNGELSVPGEKWDVSIQGKTWSVKFIDTSSKAPEIGRYKKIISDNNLINSVDKYNGLTKIFRTSNDVYVDMLKEEIWYSVISHGITGGWLIGYPYKGDIVMHMINLDSMRDLLFSGYTASPKGGLISFYSLALSSRYKNISKEYKIKIPKLNLKELKQLYLNKEENEWSKDIFGSYSNRIRPDVLRYIRENEVEIANKLLQDFEESKNNSEWTI